VGAYNIAERVFRDNAQGQSAAYQFRGQYVAYAELYRDSVRLAVAYQRWGIAPGDRVAILTNDSPVTVEAFLGALWMGAVPILLSPKLDALTLRFVLNDSQAKLVMCEQEDMERVREGIVGSGSRPEVVVQDAYAAEGPPTRHSVRRALQTLGEPPPYQWLSANDVAYWQYTSGTTGRPKAVLQHSNSMLAFFAPYARGVLGMVREDRVYSTAKLFFGYGLGASVFFNLLSGATALLDDTWPTPDSVAASIKAFGPSVVFSSPTLYHALTERGAELKAHVPPGARWVSAGSTLPAPIFDRWKARFGIELIDGIGATEMSHIFVTNRPGSAIAGSTGHAVPGFDVKLMDGEMEVTKRGFSGVMWVRGPSIAIGYANRLDEERERFRDGWYRTGDRFVLRDDGGYTYEGREDDLFKVKGRWVSPVEIESHVIGNFPQLKEVAVVPASDAYGMTHAALCAVPYAKNPSEGELAELETTMYACFRKHLASFKRPQAIHWMSTFPKNVNGKLARKRLNEMVSVPLAAGVTERDV